MEVCDEDIFNFLGRDAFAFELRRELREGVMPAAVNEEVSTLDLDGVVVRGLIAEVDNVHGCGYVIARRAKPDEAISLLRGRCLLVVSILNHRRFKNTLQL